MQLVDVPCYNCGATAREPYDSENSFHLVKCLGCGLLYVSPRPADAAITAATRTGQHRGESLLDTTSAFNAGAVTRYQRILRDFFPRGFPRRHTWLDIGCGHGELLVALGQYFGERVVARGCEPNRKKSESARGRGLDVEFFDPREHDQTYDVVSLLNVFSHLPDPVATLGQWRALVASGGHLLLETGHSAHLPSADHHKPYDLPDHLSFANREIVEGILTRVGFRVKKTMIYRHTVFPQLRIERVIRESLRYALRRKSQLRAMFPREPNRDMFVLAQRT